MFPIHDVHWTLRRCSAAFQLTQCCDKSNTNDSSSAAARPAPSLWRILCLFGPDGRSDGRVRMRPSVREVHPTVRLTFARDIQEPPEIGLSKCCSAVGGCSFHPGREAGSQAMGSEMQIFRKVLHYHLRSEGLVDTAPARLDVDTVNIPGYL